MTTPRDPPHNPLPELTADRLIAAASNEDAFIELLRAIAADRDLTPTLRRLDRLAATASNACRR